MRLRSTGSVLLSLAFLLSSCHGGSGGNGFLPGGGRSSMAGGSGITLNGVSKNAVGSTSSITVTMSPAPAAGDTEVAVVYGYNTGGTCYTLSTPSGWTLHDKTCDGRNTVWTLTHTAASGESSYTFSLSSGSDYLSAVVYDLSGVSANPIDKSGEQSFTGGAQSQSTVSLTPSQTGDLAIASFATAYVKDPSVAGWSIDANADNGIYLTTAHQAESTTGAVAASANYSSGPTSGMSDLLLIAPNPPASGMYQHAYSGISSGYNTSVTVGLSPAPAQGDTEVAVVFGYNDAGTCLQLSTPAGWTVYDSTCNGRNTVWTLTHSAGSNDTSYAFSITGGDDYLSAIVYDLKGANVVPDAHGDSPFQANSNTQTTSSLTPKTNGDLAIASFATGYVKDPSVSGWTVDANADGGVYLTAAHLALQSTSAVSATATYSGTAPASGMSNLLLIAPATQNANVLPMTPVYAYAQSTTGCGGGYDGFDETAAQDVFWAVEQCTSDPDFSSMESKCPAGGNCRIFVYESPSQLDCGGGEATEYNWLYNNPGTGDSNFTHTSSPYTSSNRVTTGGGHCDTSGGATGTYEYYPNIATSAQAGTWNNYLITNVFQGALGGSTWNGMFMDNMGAIAPSIVGGGAAPAEYPTIPAWRQAIGAEINAFSGYVTVMNSEGPGAGSFNHNNSGAVINWAIDDKDLCDALSGSGKSVIQAGLFEKLMGNNNGSSGDAFWPHNVKIAVNTAANHWADANCSGIRLMINGFTGIGGVTSWPQRAIGTVLRGLMEPNGYDGARTTPGVVMGPRYPDKVTTLDQQEVFPEDELVMTSPIQQLNAWCWGGNASCNGNGQSNGDAYGNGCYASNGDSGGINAYAKLCGQLGSDSDTGTAPVYVREFNACYRLSSLLGPCAVVYNASTSTSVTIAQLGLQHTYTHELTPADNELGDDPVHANHPLCSSSGNCTGTWATTSVTSTTTIPHCTVSGTGASATIDMMNSANTCAVILLP